MKVLENKTGKVSSFQGSRTIELKGKVAFVIDETFPSYKYLTIPKG